MKILFSPSETKNSGGVEKIFDENSFIFPQLFNKRVEIINSYNEFLTNCFNIAIRETFWYKKK